MFDYSLPYKMNKQKLKSADKIVLMNSDLQNFASWAIKHLFLKILSLFLSKLGGWQVKVGEQGGPFSFCGGSRSVGPPEVHRSLGITSLTWVSNPNHDNATEMSRWRLVFFISVFHSTFDFFYLHFVIEKVGERVRFSSGLV